MKPKVLLTNPIHPDGLAHLEQFASVVVSDSGDAGRLRDLAGDADGIIVRTKLPDDIFDFAPRLKAVVRHGVGLDMIPVARATAKGIPVANVPGANTTAVAEYCLAAMLGHVRPLARIDSAFRGQGWDAGKQLGGSCGELESLTLGIVGVGAIGGRLGTLASMLGMNVLGLARRPAAVAPPIRPVDKPTLFAQSDIVVLSCPLTPETRGLVDAAALKLMKSTALLINVSRGPVIDTPALIEALRRRELAAAVLDVYDTQPLPANDPLLQCPNLTLTSHIAGTTEQSMRRMSMGAVHELLALLQHRTSRFLVNPEVFESRDPS